MNLKINSINQNGNFDIGHTLQNSHTSNFKVLGLNAAMGDFSCASSQTNGVIADSDISDQDQIDNPSMPVANQV